jgi:hypothetical protein
VVIRPSASGATMAGQKKRRNTKEPTAVNLASGNRGMTEADIYGDQLVRDTVIKDELKHTILHIFLNETGMLMAELQISSMNTLVTMRSWTAFLWSSSGELVLEGSSSKFRS